MSHVVLTHDCNKGCSFCFAKPTRDAHACEGAHMSLETLGSVLDKLDNSQWVKLLGGEPTQHPQFAETLDLCHRRGFGVLLISNFLFSGERLGEILQRIAEGRTLGFLVNASELDALDRMAAFRRNYEAICDALLRAGRPGAIECRITVDPSFPVERHLTYVEFLRASLPSLQQLRISSICPAVRTDGNDFGFLRRTKAGADLHLVAKRIERLGMRFGVDHALWPCVYETEEQYRLLQGRCLQGAKAVCGISQAPVDYMPDGSAAFCYTNAKITVDARTVGSDADVNESLLSISKGIRDSAGLPEPCLRCPHRGSGACDGPCLGFLSH